MKRTPLKRKRHKTKRDKYKELVKYHTDLTVKTNAHRFPRSSPSGEPMEVHHRIPVHRCFNHGVPAVIAGSLENLVSLPRSENRELGVGVRPSDKGLEREWRDRGIYLPMRDKK